MTEAARAFVKMVMGERLNFHVKPDLINGRLWGDVSAQDHFDRWFEKLQSRLEKALEGAVVRGLYLDSVDLKPHLIIPLPPETKKAVTVEELIKTLEFHASNSTDADKGRLWHLIDRLKNNGIDGGGA